MITYGDAKKVLAKYQGTAGTCASAADVDIFVKQVFQYLLYQGAWGNQRKFLFHAQNGCITLPRELETPLKIKINGAVGSVWNRWFEYHSGTELESGCLPAQDSLLLQPNLYPTVYDITTCGSYVGVIGTCCEAADAHVVVKGTDATGRVIYTMHNGEKIVGEYLTIKKNEITRSTVKFAKITEVAKTKTNGYVTLLQVSDDELQRSFLSDYDPYETTPAYQRATIIHVPKCPPICSVSILGRIRLKDHYSDDDIIPFDNLYLLAVAGQTINKMHNSDVQTAAAQDTYAKGLITAEGNYKTPNNGQTIEIFRGLSAGLVKNARQAARTLRRRNV